tara:strand:+ start:980 stop:1897 length:918 start_codon:yes stop_codon:yes gene_type:complete
MEIGYACINTHLSERPKSTKITTNRSMIKRTFAERGIPYASELALQNCLDLSKIIQWNEDNDIRLFRMSSNIFPWVSEYSLTDLPDYENICYALMEAGDLANKYNHRLTFHPGPFNKLCAKEERIVNNTINELEHHSELFDIMGFAPSYYNKINIHIGAAYDNKRETAYRFCKNYDRLSNNLKARLTVENDDKPSLFTTEELYKYMWLDIGCPIVFDFHHHNLHDGGLRQDEALDYAMETWKDVRPICHVSESRRDEQKIQCLPQAHSDYINSPVQTYGHNFDIMIEAKRKELAVFRYKEILKNN